MRAVKDISKEEEVTIFYSPESALPWLHVDMIETIQEDFGVDCKCPVCSGEVPDQDDTMRKIVDVLNSKRIRSKDEKDVTGLEMAKLKAAIEYDQPSHIVKAVDGIKELTENLGLEVFK